MYEPILARMRCWWSNVFRVREGRKEGERGREKEEEKKRDLRNNTFIEYDDKWKLSVARSNITGSLMASHGTFTLGKHNWNGVAILNF